MALLTPRHALALALVLLAAALGLFRILAPAPLEPAATLPAVHVGIPRQPANAAWFIALQHRLFEAEGVQVVEHPYDIGLQAMQAVMDGQIDLGVVADTPFVFAVLEGAELSIVATSYNSRTSLAISARRDAGISEPLDLRGRTIGYVPRTNAHFFLDTFLLSHGMSRDEATLVTLRPNQVLGHLTQGKVHAVATWEPVRAQLREAVGPTLVEFTGAELYAFRFNLVGRTADVADRTPELAAVLRALHRASQVLAGNPAAATALTERHLGLPVPQPLNPLEHAVVLDQALVMALEDEARWAIGAGLAPGRPGLNFLRHIAPAALRQAVPTQVTLVH